MKNQNSDMDDGEKNRRRNNTLRQKKKSSEIRKNRFGFENYEETTSPLTKLPSFNPKEEWAQEYNKQFGDEPSFF